MNKGSSAAFAMSLFLVIFLLQVGGHPASAHFNTLAPDTDVQLQWPLNNSYSMSVDLKVVKSPEANASIFWGYQFTFVNGEKGFVAIGIGGTPKVATVGVFDAVSGSTSNPTGACTAGISFLKAGSGYQCFIIYDWNLGFNYQLQFSRISDSGGNEQWEGSIRDYSANSSTIIGDILVPTTYNQLSTNSSTWDEYSAAGSCDTTPTSVIFSSPNASNASGNHAPAEAQVTYGNNLCQDSNVVYLGGGAYQADAGKDVSRTTPAQTWLWTQEPSLTSQNSASTATTTSPTSATSTTSSSIASSVASSSTTITITQSKTSTTTPFNTTPLATTPVPGFPWESILLGIIAGLTVLGMARNHRQARD